VPAHLLDINVLVALFDPSHVHHDTAHQWFQRLDAEGWASCPLTENGFARVVSSTAYPGRRTTVAEAVRRLRRFRDSTRHTFWPDTVSLCERDLVEWRRVQGHRQLTDLYLLALAVRHDGCLATFDRTAPSNALVRARTEHLAVIEAAG
jgi:hypothetical protein